MKLLLVLLSIIQIGWIRCIYLDIIRGNFDRFNSKIRHSKDNIKCKRDHYCSCTGIYHTFIYDNREQSGKCVKDQDIITDGSGGRYLPEGESKCLGVSGDDKVVKVRCRKDNFSVRWLWTDIGQMVNLRTLKCLQAKRPRKIKNKRRNRKRKNELPILERCDKNNTDQRWRCSRKSRRPTIVNQGQDGYKKKWIKKRRSSLYFTDCNSDRSSFKGCYRFSDGQFVRLVNNSVSCRTSKEGNCTLTFTIRAPIYLQHTRCGLDWSNSKYSFDGDIWIYIQDDAEEFSLRTKPNEIVLTVWDKSSLLRKWPGSLLRLEIVCESSFFNSSENHCVLLKIANDKTTKVPSTTTLSTTLPAPSSTSPTPSASPSTLSSVIFSKSFSTPPLTKISKLSSTLISTSSYTQAPTTSEMFGGGRTPNLPETASEILIDLKSSTLPRDAGSNNLGRKSDEDSSNIIPIVAPAVALFCLLIATIGIALLYRRRKRSNSKQENINLYEESTGSNNERRQRLSQAGDLHELSEAYENPVNQEYASVEYESPHNESVGPNSQKNSENNNDNVIPREANLTSRENNGTSTVDETFPVDHLYQEIDEKPSNEIPRVNNNNIIHQGYHCSGGQSGDSPIYHTLEDPDETQSNKEGIYETLDERAANEPFYNVLEGP